MLRARALAGGAALAVALLAVPRSEALQLTLSRSQLCSISDMVVVGRVSDMETLWAATEEGGLERHAFVDVWRTARGPAVSMTDVTLPGGKMGEYWHWVEDVPELEPGAHYMLFLGKTPFGWQVLGGEQGAVRVAYNDFGTGETVAEAVASLGGCDGR